MTLPRYDVLTPEQTAAVHQAALDVLARAGAAVDHPLALEASAGHGAKISDDRRRIFWPADAVEKLLAKAPREFLCAAPDRTHDLIMRQGESWTRQGGGPFSIYDLRSGAARPLTLEDCRDSHRLINALPHINCASTMTPQDVNAAVYDVAAVKTALEHSNKHFWALTTGASHLKYELELAAAVVGGRAELAKRPILSGVFCVIAPLRFPADEIDRLLLCGDYGLHVMTPLTVLMGGSAPYSLAGCLTQMTAEFLASVCLAQALRPGIGQWLYTLFQQLDMRTGRGVAHSPELTLLGAASAQMSAFYGLPSLANTLLSGDCQPHQIIFQYGVNILMALLNGVTFQAGAGSLEYGNLYSHQALAIIDEFLDYLKVVTRGLEISPETLAVDDIVECAERGEYLSSRLTLKLLRREKRHEPDLTLWTTLDNWRRNPETLLDRAESKVRKILAAAPRDSRLPAETRRELDGIMAAAVKAFC
jgi:trimethylamine--corrinoid protein Co-methyltransferase